MKEFKVNEYITLKLEGGKTNIYISGRLFQQCKFLLLNISVEEVSSFDEIESIDEAAEKLDRSLEGNSNEIEIPPEAEFWGHCSNMQVWAEHDYDSRLLHRTLAFPLLKKLTEEGDSLAQQVFKEEIARRVLTGNRSVILYLRDYLHYISLEELIIIFDDPNSQFYKILHNSFENAKERMRFGYSILATFAELGVPKAQVLLTQKFKEEILSKNHSEIVYLKQYFRYIPIDELNVIISNKDFINDIQTSFQDISKAKSFVFPVLADLMELGVVKAKEMLAGLIKKVLHGNDVQYFSLLSMLLEKNYFDLFSLEDLHEFIYDKTNNIIENLKGNERNILFVYPILNISAEKGDIRSANILKSLISERFNNDLENMIDFLNRNKYLLRYLIPLEEFRGINKLNKILPEKLILVEPFRYDLTKKRYSDDLIPNWWDHPFQFYIKNNHVEGIALMDTNHCESCLQDKHLQVEYGEIDPGSSSLCKNCGIHEIPSDIVVFQELKQLFVYANSYFGNQYIREWLGRLKSLKVLYLYACGSDNLGVVLSGLSSLKKLVINESHIRKLPLSIGSLKNLEYLDLEWCYINTLPKPIGNLTNLKTIILDNNPISYLPESMRQLENLQTFSLKNTNHSGYYQYDLKEFPEVLCRITSLQNLYLERNQIKDIPNCLGDLTNLKELSLNNTQINILPRSIGKLRNLKSLFLEDCKLSSFPDTLTNLMSLRTLNIRGNILSSLSEKVLNFLLELKAIPEKDLVYLQVDKTQAKILSEIEKLTRSKLNLVQRIKRRDSLSFFWGRGTPDQFAIENNKVVGLRITSNQDIRGLIGKIITLKHLDLNNTFDIIPPSFKNLKDLEILLLKGCSIEEIKNLENFPKLRELDLSSNKISEIKGLDNLTNLESLNLEYNNITEIKGLDTLINLHDLNLSYNKINEIRGLDSLINLVDLKLFHNHIKEIKGLENLTNLWFISLGLNEIPDNLIKTIAGERHEDTQGYKFVLYCQNKVVEQQNLQNQYVTFQGKKFYVWNRTLRIKKEGLKDIRQIEGFQNITDIDTLDLSYNEISEIKDLDHLTNLKVLRLYSNKIKEIKGLDHLTALEVLDISSNSIREIKGLENLRQLKSLSLSHNRIDVIKNIGHLDKLEHLSVHISEKFWQDLKIKMGEDFYREIGVIHRGLQIKSPKKVVEYCRIIENKNK